MDIIFDIDGTLADASHRLHHITPRPQGVSLFNEETWPSSFKKNWDAFLHPDAVAKDAPIIPIWEILYSLLDAGNRILFITGRSDALRQTTAAWLTNQECVIRRRLGTLLERQAIDLQIFMRKDGDRRPSHQTKEEGLFQARLDGFDPKLVFEDRDDDTEMWRRNGLVCCQVAKGDY